MNNLSIEKAYEIEAVFTETKIKAAEGTILTDEMHAHNTFEEPDAVAPECFDNAEVDGNIVRFTIPPCAVLHLALEV